MTYTLTIERLRQIYVLNATSGMPVLSRSADEEKVIAGTIFDRAMAERDREVASNAQADLLRRIVAWVRDQGVDQDSLYDDLADDLHVYFKETWDDGASAGAEPGHWPADSSARYHYGHDAEHCPASSGSRS